jgi:hypothetical protein
MASTEVQAQHVQQTCHSHISFCIPARLGSAVANPYRRQVQWSDLVGRQYDRLITFWWCSACLHACGGTEAWLSREICSGSSMTEPLTIQYMACTCTAMMVVQYECTVVLTKPPTAVGSLREHKILQVFETVLWDVYYVGGRVTAGSAS